MIEEPGPTNSPPWIDPWYQFQRTCLSCRYHVIKQSGSEIGRCRRHAPTVEGYPMVFTYLDWCGDFKVKPHFYQHDIRPPEEPEQPA